MVLNRFLGTLLQLEQSGISILPMHFTVFLYDFKNIYRKDKYSFIHQRPTVLGFTNGRSEWNVDELRIRDL